MRVEQDAFYLQKAGNAPEEYEDAFWLPRDAHKQAAVYRCAIADGATETSFSALWARFLVEAHGEGTIRKRLDQQVLAPLQRWAAAVCGQPLPWYAEEKVRQGAYASFLGLRLVRSRQHSHGRWHALAVGDSCLFQLRGAEIAATFPIKRSSGFNNRPFLISSIPSRSERLGEHVALLSGTWQEDDLFFLITDALACWFLQRVEAGERPWEELRDYTGAARRLPFQEWIGALRASGALRNDDVTLLRIEPHL
jgi:hypothetical protein